MSETRACTSCSREIDAWAKICPYCAADPATGQQNAETREILEQHFPKRPVLGTGDRAMQFLRERQTIVVVLLAAAAMLGVVTAHRIISERNEAMGSDAPAVPLAEIVEATSGDTQDLPLPKLEFQFSGDPRSFRTFVMEPGAVPPPPEEVQKVIGTGSGAQAVDSMVRRQAAARQQRPLQPAPSPTAPPAAAPQMPGSVEATTPSPLPSPLAPPAVTPQPQPVEPQLPTQTTSPFTTTQPPPPPPPPPNGSEQPDAQP